MSNCPCCLTTNLKVKVNGEDISRMISAVSVDTAPDVIREPASTKCEVLPNEWMMLFGPGKTTVQITAYPFGGNIPPDLGGLACATNVNISVPWKYVYDCRLDADCVDKNGNISTRKGKWVLLPMKKKTIMITGDITGAQTFKVGGCTVPAPKFSVQAGVHQYYQPQETIQYSSLQYTGIPIQIDTDNLNSTFDLQIISDTHCGGFPKLEAYLTSFGFSFTPPSQSSVTYTWEVPYTTCPGTCQ